MEQFMKATDREAPSVVGGKPLIGAHPMPNERANASRGRTSGRVRT